MSNTVINYLHACFYILIYFILFCLHDSVLWLLSQLERRHLGLKIIIHLKESLIYYYTIGYLTG